MTETKFTPGPFEARVVNGWGDTPCVMAVGSDRPIANFTRPKDYYTEYVKRTDANGEEWAVLSDDAARKAGNYVPTKEYRQKVVSEQMATAHLFAKSPEFYEISEVHERRLRDCARNIQDEFPLWSKDLEKMADALSELLAKARGEQS